MVYQNNRDLAITLIGFIMAIFVISVLFYVIINYLFEDFQEDNKMLVEAKTGFIDYNIQNTDHTTGYLIQCARKLNYTVHTIIGASMEPTFFHGDKVICDNSLRAEIGDIVIVNDSMPVAHRIVADYGSYLVTKGDNRITEDQRINRTQIECVVVGGSY